MFQQGLARQSVFGLLHHARNSARILSRLAFIFPGRLAVKRESAPKLLSQVPSLVPFSPVWLTPAPADRLRRGDAVAIRDLSDLESKSDRHIGGS